MLALAVFLRLPVDNMWVSGAVICGLLLPEWLVNKKEARRQEPAETRGKEVSMVKILRQEPI